MARNFVAASFNYLSSTSTSLRLTGAMSIGCWVKSTGSYAANRGIMARYLGSGNQRSYSLYIDASGRPGFALSTDGTFQSGNVITGASAIGTAWVHVLATFNPSVRQELWVGGVSVASKTSSVVPAIFAGTSDFWVGAQFAAGQAVNHWDGSIAVPCVWNTVIAGADVASLAAGTYSGLVQPSSIVSLWDLAGASPEPDSVGGADLTLSGTTYVADPPLTYGGRLKRVGYNGGFATPYNGGLAG